MKPSDIVVRREASGDNRPLLTPPVNLTIELVDESSVMLLWQETRDSNIGNYIILRSDNPDSPLTEIARVAGNESSYVDTTVELGKTYSYRVQSYALDAVPGNSDVKTVQITSNVINTQTTASELSSLPLPIAITERNFWTSMLGVNAVIIGVLIILYMTIRTIVFSFSKRGSVDKLSGEHKDNVAIRLQQELKESTAEPKKLPGLKIDAKLGSKDKNIVKTAKNNYSSDRIGKLTEWEKMGK